MKAYLVIFILISFGIRMITFAQSSYDNMVLVPGGTFIMGKDSKKEADYNPSHRVKIDSFMMDCYEVTNRQYYEFCQETNHRLPEFWGNDFYNCGLEYPDHPVTGISWFDAQNYAQWAGKRLPTEAEWEYAARGGLENFNYPGSNELDTTIANYSARSSKTTTVAGIFVANEYGLFDMAGNVWEWVNDYYDYEYYKISEEENPKGPQKGRFRVIRGGSWHSGSFCNRVYYRNALPPNWVDFAVGFRCVKDLH